MAHSEAQHPTGERRWVFLDVCRDLEADPETSGLLARELVRQAVLLAAREEFGLITRDLVLGELQPDPDARGGSIVAGVTVKPDTVEVSLSRVSDSENPPEPWWRLQSPLTPTPVNSLSYAGLAAWAESISRLELVEAFQEQSLNPSRPAWHPKAGISPTVAPLLERYNAFARFEALRRIHAEIRLKGESPERLGALVRGYAGLGQMTRFHWSAAEQVCYARALLYAHRLVARTDGAPLALWHRAFAWSMAGLPVYALADLERAGTAARDGTSAPDWVEVLAAYAREESEMLEEWSSEPGARGALAGYLRFLIAERLHDLNFTSEFGEAFLERSPDTLRIVQSIAARAGVANLHAQTHRAAQIMQTVPARELAAMENLPDAVRRLLPDMTRQAWPSIALRDAAAALIQASAPDDDAIEPSWAVLGRFLEDAQMVTVFRRAYFMKYRWSVDVNRFLDDAVPAVANHRYAPLIEVMRLDTRHQTQAVDDIVGGIVFGDLNLTAQPLFDGRFWGRSPEVQPLRRKLWIRLQKGSDANALDLSEWLARWPTASKAIRLRKGELLGYAAPHSSIPVSIRLELDWDQMKTDVPELLARHENDPIVLRSLAQKLIEKDDPPETVIPLLERYIDLTRSRWGYTELAALHLKTGDEANWLLTLQRFLEAGEDRGGLGRTRVRNDIARHFMRQERFEEAQPYAEAAAQSWAAWAMNTATICYEGLQDWGRSEHWVRRESERYSHCGVSVFRWYWWCRRTGRGSPRDAAALVRNWRNRTQDGDLTQSERYRMAFFHYLEDEIEAAIEMMREIADNVTNETPWPYVYLFVYADRLGDAALRHEMLERLKAYRDEGIGGRRWRVCFEILDLFEPALTGQDAEVPSEETIDRMISRFRNRAVDYYNFIYVTGELLRMTGHPEKARRRFASGIRATSQEVVDQTTIYHLLRVDGIDPYNLPEAYR